MLFPVRIWDLNFGHTYCRALREDGTVEVLHFARASVLEVANYIKTHPGCDHFEAHAWAKSPDGVSSVDFLRACGIDVRRAAPRIEALPGPATSSRTRVVECEVTPRQVVDPREFGPPVMYVGRIKEA